VNVAVDHLIVNAADASEFGDLELSLTGGHTLRLFPTQATEEAWRLFRPGEQAPHFVAPVPAGTTASSTDA
jgi:acyl dehydratase